MMTVSALRKILAQKKTYQNLSNNLLWISSFSSCLGLESDDLLSKPFLSNEIGKHLSQKAMLTSGSVQCIRGLHRQIRYASKMMPFQPNWISTESNMNSLWFYPLHAPCFKCAFSAQKHKMQPSDVQAALFTVQSQRMSYTRHVLGRTEWTGWAASLVNIYATRLTLNICSATCPGFYRL